MALACSLHPSRAWWSAAVAALAVVVADCGDDDGVLPDAGPPPPVAPPTIDLGVPPADSGPTVVDADRGPCEPTGSTREVPCGRCGVASQTCGADGRWSEATRCFDESGECVAGSVEASCGRERLCRSDCTWTDWNGERAGECEPGETMFTTDECMLGARRTHVCSADCRFEPMGECASACGRPPHPSRSGADPVCIPAGPFVLGTTELPDTQPVRTITLSDLYMDRFPVSKRRYMQCIEDGGCPPVDEAYRPLVDATEDDDAALAFFGGGTNAVAFCAWDGGRLMSEFEFEKACRGPAPDARRHAWGDDDGVACRHHPGEGCYEDTVALTEFPEAVSPYGIRLLGVVSEVTRSAERVDYAELADRDPETEGSDAAGYAGRGYDWPLTGEAMPSASFRMWWGIAIRCVY